MDLSIYDAMFVSNTDNTIPSIDGIDPECALPLMLKSDSQIGYSLVLASPISQVPEGAPKDSSLGTWSAYSQDSWDGGMLEQYAPDSSKKSGFAIADTRYANKATLPPAVYGPYTIQDLTAASGPATIGNSETVKTRWVQYLEYMYVLAGGKLFRSVFDETAISNGTLTPNWKFVQSGIGTISATDINLFLQSGTWKLLTAASSGVCISDPSTGLYESNPAQVAKSIIVIDNTAVALTSENKFSAGTSLAATAELVTGDITLRVNGYFKLGNSSYVLTNKGIFTAVAATGKLTVPFGEYSSNDSGTVYAIWNGKIYIALSNTLQSWDGTTVNMSLCGLDRNAGLPSDVATKITWLESSATTLYAATNETGKRSAIFCMTAENSWHCLYLSNNSTDFIASLGIDTRGGRQSGGGTDNIIVLQPRLWFAINNKSYYMFVGDNKSNNTFESLSGIKVKRNFNLQGEILSSLWTGKYTGVQKMFIGGTVVLEKFVEGTTVDLEIEVDNSGVFTSLKKIINCNKIEFITTAPAWKKAKITYASDKYIQCDSTLISVGDCVRIGQEVVQIKSIGGNGELYLSGCLPFVPSVGAYIYPSRLMGNEFRTRMKLSSTDPTLTPVIKRLTVDFSHRVLMRARHVLHVIVADGLKDRQGGMIQLKGKQISNALRVWASKEPFWLKTPDEDWRIVKVVNHSQAQYIWPDSTKQKQNPRSIATITLIEVEDGL